MDPKLEQLKRDYMEIPIPDELPAIVSKALKYQKKQRSYSMIATIAAAIVLALGLGVNLSPALARTLSELPVVGGIVRVITFREFTYEDERFQADVEVPAIQNLDPTLEDDLNTKYLEEGKRLYEEFMAEMESIKEAGEGHLSVASGYIVKTDNDRILSVGRYVVKSMGSSSDEIEYDTIDKQNKILITLPSLFRDDDYITVISEYIKQQMRERMEADEGIIYWLPEVEQYGSTTVFESIDRDQEFYIDENGKLVISFNKYEVAPGYMGIVEFTIPTEVIADELVSHEYIH